MDQFSFTFTILFMLLGPFKLIPLFGSVTKDEDVRFKRSVAWRSVVIASVLCAFVALAGGTLLSKYRISIDAVRIGGGLVILIAALRVLFQRAPAPHARTDSGSVSALQLAATPIAVPGIVPPAGIAAILLFMLHATQYPGIEQAVAISLAITMLLNFLLMYFIDLLLRTPGLTLVLSVLGSVLTFVQISLAIQMMLVAATHLGVIRL